MANIATPRMIVSSDTHQLAVSRLLVAGGITAAVIFIVCWLGTFLPFSSPTHAFIMLFTQRDAHSVAALAEGAVWALLFGALSGALFAIVYNATASLGKR
jgi:uncharacterized SAM-binding protein YcdF (DUF218 family)